MHESLWSVARLRAALDTRDLRIVDVRWYLGEPGRGQREYLAGHVPGAVYLDIDTDLSGPKGSGPGRHPLPTPAYFAEIAGRAGIDDTMQVVAYDAAGGAHAARLWWLLRWLGHPRVALLDGGWQAWLAASGPTSELAPQVAPTIFIPRPQAGMIVDADAVDALRTDPHALLLDARAGERYRGETEPIDARAGHIPGARSAPFAGNLTADGMFATPDQLAERFAVLGAATDRVASPLVCYCGSGVTATHNLFALHLAGRDDALLYPGSWSDWSSDPARPVAMGNDR